MKKVFVVFFALTLFSCATITRFEPKNELDSLVIGKIEMENKNFKVYGSLTVNGIQKENIEVSISNLTSGEIIKTRTDNEGFFMFYNLNPSDNYQITRIYLRREEESGWADVGMYTSNTYTFSSKSNSISDIGSFLLKADGIKNTTNFNKVGNSIFKEFVIKYKDSKWLNKTLIKK